jgi:hypothetical protein
VIGHPRGQRGLQDGSGHAREQGLRAGHGTPSLCLFQQAAGERHLHILLSGLPAAASRRVPRFQSPIIFPARATAPAFRITASHTISLTVPQAA